ncbi:unnamed protein product [Prorocentrum cordatum]|uniref:Uncharacterized protein n=1 Tax=Prorocentrum cordatum TaxID=2364126 RepID=A0ABN9U9Q2_9DINO|nr:unnamed protein product [Polarella glacialis]
MSGQLAALEPAPWQQPSSKPLGKVGNLSRNGYGLTQEGVMSRAVDLALRRALWITDERARPQAAERTGTEAAAGPLAADAGAHRRAVAGGSGPQGADDEYSSDDSSSRNRTKLARNVGFDRQQRDAENAAKVAEQLEKINAQRTMLQPVFAENPEVEAFLKTHHEIEPRAVAQLRAMPHEQARMVITGPLDRARNKTAVILARRSRT